MDQDTDLVKQGLKRLREDNIRSEKRLDKLQKMKRNMQIPVSDLQKQVSATLFAQAANKQAVKHDADKYMELCSKSDQLRAESHAVFDMLAAISQDNDTLGEQASDFEQILTSMENLSTLNVQLKSIQKKFSKTEEEMRAEIAKQDIWKNKLADLGNQISDVESFLEEQYLQCLDIKHKALEEQLKNSELESACVNESIAELDSKIKKAEVQHQELTSIVNTDSTKHLDEFKNIQLALREMAAKSELHSDQLQGLQQTQEGQHEQHLQADIGMVEQEQIFLSLQYKMNCSNSQLLLEKRRNLLKGAEYEFGPDNLKDPEEINKIIEYIKKKEVSKVVSKGADNESVGKNYDQNLKNMSQSKEMLQTNISEITEKTKAIQKDFGLASVEFQEMESTFMKQSQEQLEKEKQMQAEADKFSLEIQEIASVDTEVEKQINFLSEQEEEMNEQIYAMKNKLSVLLKENDKTEKATKDLDKINDELTYELAKLHNHIALLTMQQKHKDKKLKAKKSSSLSLADWLDRYKKSKSN